MKNNNLKHTLRKIENIILQNLNKDDGQQSYSEEVIASHFKLIKNELLVSVLESKTSFDRWVVYLQLELQNLLELVERNQKHSLGKTHELFFSITLKSFMLIDELQKDFSAVYRFDFRAPMIYFKHKSEQFRVAIESLNHHLQEVTIDKRLYEILKSHLNAFSNLKDLTYHQINAFEVRLALLNNCLQNSGESELNDKLRLALIRQVFNEEAFISYIVDCINEEMLASKTALDLFLNKWRLIIWSIEKITTGKANKVDLAKILEKALKQKESIERIKLAKGKDSLPYFHAHTNLIQLLYFFQLMLDAELLSCKNRTEIFNFISDHIETDRIAHPSLGSMQRKFGTASKMDKIKIKNFLIKMLNQVNQEKFN